MSTQIPQATGDLVTYLKRQFPFYLKLFQALNCLEGFCSWFLWLVAQIILKFKIFISFDLIASDMPNMQQRRITSPTWIQPINNVLQNLHTTYCTSHITDPNQSSIYQERLKVTAPAWFKTYLAYKQKRKLPRHQQKGPIIVQKALIFEWQPTLCLKNNRWVKTLFKTQ